jgi:hypothetical protein
MKTRYIMYNIIEQVAPENGLGDYYIMRTKFTGETMEITNTIVAGPYNPRELAEQRLKEIEETGV